MGHNISDNKHFSESVNIFRAFGIVAVMCIHISAVFTSFQELNAIYKFYSLVDIFTRVAIPLFVFISGYVLTTRYVNIGSKKDLIQYYVRRVLRVIPSYLAVSLLYILIFKSGNISIEAVIGMLAAGKAYYHLWYFLLLSQLYLIFPVLLYFYRRFFSHKPALYVLINLIVQLVWYSLLSTNLNMSGEVNRNVFLADVFYFSLGIVLAGNKNSFDVILKKKWIRIGLLCSVSLFAIAMYKLWIGAKVHFGGFYSMTFAYWNICLIVGCFFYTSMLLMLFSARRIFIRHTALKKALNLLAKNAFSIYLLHPLLLFYLVQYINSRGLNATSFAYFPVVLTLITALSLALVILINKVGRFWSRYFLRPAVLPGAEGVSRTRI